MFKSCQECEDRFKELFFFTNELLLWLGIDNISDDLPEDEADKRANDYQFWANKFNSLNIPDCGRSPECLHEQYKREYKENLEKGRFR